MPYEDNNFGGSLVLDFAKWRRHVLPKNFANTTLTIWAYKVLSNVYIFFIKVLSITAGSMEFQVPNKPL